MPANHMWISRGCVILMHGFLKGVYLKLPSFMKKNLSKDRLPMEKNNLCVETVIQRSPHIYETI